MWLVEGGGLCGVDGVRTKMGSADETGTRCGHEAIVSLLGGPQAVQ